MKTKAFLSLFLAAALLLPLASCSAPAETPDTETTASPESTVLPTETEPPETSVLHELEGMDFEGADYRITYLKAMDETYARHICVEEENGEILNDTSLARYRRIEETLNVNFAFYPQDGTNLAPTISPVILAGDDAYDLIHFFSGWDNAISLVRSHALYNLADIPHMHLDADYFYGDINESLMINDRLYFAFSNYGNSGALPLYMVFNKTLMEDLGMELPYETILAGDWTYDRFLGYVTDGYSDLNGDGAKDPDDRYGYANASGLTNYLVFGFEVSVVERSESGAYKPALQNEKLITAIQTIVEFGKKHPDIFNKPNPQHAPDNLHVFLRGNTLFTTNGTSSLENYLREIEDFDFGLAPFPKFDDNQKKYSGNLVPDQFSVPINVPDSRIGMVGAVTEALAIVSDELMTPAYLEVFVERKLLRDPESIEVARLMMKDVSIDISRYYDFAGGLITPQQLLENIRDSSAVVSYLAAIGRKTEKSAEDFFEIFFEEE